jgi:hypothetical protein
MTWNGFFTLAISPDVMLPAVAQEVPAQLAEISLQVASLHGRDCTRIGVHCQEPPCLSHRTPALTCCRKPQRRRRAGFRQSGAVRGSALDCRGEAPWPPPYSKPHSLVPVPPSMAECGERQPLATQETPFDAEPHGSDAFFIPTVASQSPVRVVYTERAPGRRWCGWCDLCPADRPA